MNHPTFRTGLKAATAMALSGLTGCAVLSSTELNSSIPAVGQPYMLPKALLPVELVESGGQISLRVLPPRLVGDPKAQYVLSRQSSPFASDDIKVDVTDGMLSSITATTEDKLLEALKALFTGTAKDDKKEGADASGSTETVLFRGDFDPDDKADEGSCSDATTATHGNKLLLADISCAIQRRRASLEAACSANAAQPADNCASVKPLLASLKAMPAGGPTLRLWARPVAGSDRASPEGSQAVPPPCHIGICQRSLRLFELRSAIVGLGAQQTMLPLPNGGPVVALPLERAAFVKTEHTVTFNGGTVTSAKVVHGSSALALLSWPLDVYRAFISATSEIIQLRIDTRAKEVEGVKSEVDTLKALLDLQKKRDEAIAGSKESAKAAPAPLPPAGAGAAATPLPSVNAPPLVAPLTPATAAPRPPALLKLTIG